MLEMLKLFFLVVPFVIFVVSVIQIIKKDYFEDIEWYIKTVMEILAFITANPIMFYEWLLLKEDK